MIAGTSFGQFTDAEWASFLISGLAALGTLAAVVVTVIDSMRANRRASAADERAAYAEAARAAVEEAEAKRNRGKIIAERAEIESEIVKTNAWLQVALSYGDTMRQSLLQSKLVELQGKLDALPAVPADIPTGP